MSLDENKKLVLGFFDNMNAGKADKLYAALADHATWWVQGNQEYSGTRSKSEVMALRSQLLPQVDGGVQMTPTGITAEGDRVAVEAESYVKLKNGNLFQNTYHFLFIVRRGKIESVREYMDTLHAREMLHA